MQPTDPSTAQPPPDADPSPAPQASGHDLVGRMITLSGLLAGFCFTALIQLITLDDNRDVVALTIVFSLLSAVTYILSLFSFVASTTISLATPRTRATAASIELFAFYIFWVATVGLLITIALAGWVHSTLVGAVAAAIALLALAGLAALLFIRGNAL